MSQTPFEQTRELRIGTVDFVSPDEIKVSLEVEAPESVVLNLGVPRPFPRVNSYLLIPVDEIFLVGQVEWITIEHSPFPKRRGMQDFGLVDLPYPLRRLRLNPLGTLRAHPDKTEHTFTRGTNALPSLGSSVVLPTEPQLRSIVESGEHRRVKIGTSPLAGDAEVYVDPDRLFGRHLAVLGNTGSGKSCSIAGLIRWSLEQARQQSSGHPNARFIVLDPNGEYSRAFNGDDPVKARIFKINPSEDKGEMDLKVPLWFWNSAEWCAFLQASSQSQRPSLLNALREVRSNQEKSDVNVDTPQFFNGESLRNAVNNHCQSHHCYSLKLRLEELINDIRIKPIVDSEIKIDLNKWLEDYIGKSNNEQGSISIIDLSLVSSDVVHIITAVIARMVFEALQRYVKLNQVSLPTVLVMEEAHTFVKRYRQEVDNQDAATICCQAFERIAREGRKFGLGLVLSSQRPSELSPSVLSQCNSFVLHRISNDRDQEIIHRFVPDNLRGLLRELPSLPSRSAILLGWASELPVLVTMNDLPEAQQPRSDDPEFWDVWTGTKNRSVDWQEFANDWQGNSE
ncbi:MAG: ATP-binding protein [Aphanocapsa feldmannii 277cI]|uniref:ATP-binding protein n=1 Tax=Aphanocapsa feldmannii 277cI TaxID=2507554 RepID=A0A524RS70_9CHRO|nr:MAG: ATP-binding protein [Aphanocapsa feldmannii 277cI]